MPNVGIVFNIRGNEEAVCYISDGDESGLIKNIVDYLDSLSGSALEILQNKYQHVFKALKDAKIVKVKIFLKNLKLIC